MKTEGDILEKKQKTGKQQNMGTESIPKLLAQLAIPAT